MAELVPWWNLLPRPPDLSGGQQLQNQALQLKIQQAQQQQAGYNAMAKLFSDPSNLENGVLKPEAVSQLAGIYPPVALDLMQTQAKIGQEKQLSAMRGQQFVQKMNENSVKEMAPLLATYDQDKGAIGDEAAKQKYQASRSEVIDRMASSGTYTPQFIEGIRRNPGDPEQLRAAVLGKSAIQSPAQQRDEGRKEEDLKLREAAGARAEDKDRRAAVTPKFVGQVDDGKGGKTEVRYSYDSTGAAIDDTGQAVDTTKLSGVRPIGKGGATGEFSAAKEITVVDKDGGVVMQTAASQRKDSPGWFDTSSGSQIEVPPGGRVVLGKQGAGRLAATQIQTIIGSANEAAGELRNLMELPSTATSGVFMGVQAEHPDSLLGGINRVLANKITPQAAQDLKATFLGMSRSLAAIEGQGARTGMVGLSKQMEGYIPQEGDTGPTVLRKYASMRQVIERGLHTMMANPEVGGEQRKLLGGILKEIEGAVPFTVRDVNDLERQEIKSKHWWESASSGYSSESVQEFAKRVMLNKRDAEKAAPEPRSDATPSSPSRAAQKDTIEPAGAPGGAEAGRMGAAAGEAGPSVADLPKEKRFGGSVVQMRDPSGAVHTFVVSPDAKTLIPLGGRP
jgi:hypothetical protein